MQRNAFGPDDTTVHSMHVAEDAAHGAIAEIRHKLSKTFSPTRGGVDEAATAVGDTIRHEAHEVQNVVERAEAKAKELARVASRASQDEEEGWQSEAEAEDEGETSMQGRQKSKSKSPKIKPPKLAVLRPVTGATRRRSMRKGMLGARALGRPHLDEFPASPPLVSPEGSSPTTPSTEDFSRRGRHSTPISTPLGSPISPASSSSARIRHARIDSLRSIDERHRRSLREASPARSIRWADAPDTEYTHGRSGASTPRRTSTPLPGSQTGSEDEGEGGGEGGESPWSGAQVRFDIPDSPHSGRSQT